MSTLVRPTEQRESDAASGAAAPARAARFGAWSYGAVVVAAGLLLAAPAIFWKFPPITDDAPYHAVWYTEFAGQLWAGDVYPRWLSGMNGGLGSPSLFFYGPLPYYLTALLRPLFPADAQGWQQLGIGAAAAMVASGVTSFLWLRRLAGGATYATYAATAGAVVYMLTPYHAAVDLYSRGAYAEFWAFVWMPLVLLCVCRVAEGSRRALVGLAVAYALLITTHLPTTLLFSLVPPAYALVVARGRVRVFVMTCAGMALGIGLAAVYLLPALALRGEVGAAQQGFYHYGRWFLLSSPRLWGDVTPKLTAMLLTVLGFVGCALVLLWRARVKDDARREVLFWSAVAASSVLMMTPLSEPVWRLVGPLQAVQFPYRFNTVLAVAASALACLALAAVARRAARLDGLQLLAAAGACLTVCVWLAATALAARTAFFQTNDAPVDAARIASAFRYNADFAEYAPRWSETIRSGELASLLARRDGLPDKRVSAGRGASVEVKRWRPRDITLSVDGREEGWLTVGQLYYPGWTARVEGDDRELAVRPSSRDGLVEVLAPEGRHELSVRLEPGVAERAGKIVSLASAACAALLLCYLYAAGRRAPASSEA